MPSINNIVYEKISLGTKLAFGTGALSGAYLANKYSKTKEKIEKRAREQARKELMNQEHTYSEPDNEHDSRFARG